LSIEQQEVETGISQHGHVASCRSGSSDNGLAGFQKISNDVHISKFSGYLAVITKQVPSTDSEGLELWRIVAQIGKAGRLRSTRLVHAQHTHVKDRIRRLL